MPAQIPSVGGHAVIAKPALQQVFDALRADGYTLVGPTVADGAIIYDEIASIDDLPVGWTDEQAAGRYRLRRRADGRYFGYVVGPHSLKRFLFPPRIKLFSTRRRADGFDVQPNVDPAPRYAFVGVRGCEVAAVAVQDRVFLEGAAQDPLYRARREAAFILAVNCVEPGGTCFCASMKTGPRCAGGFDLALTELDDIFLVEIGSELGAHMLSAAEWRPAGAFEMARGRRALADAEGKMGRVLDTRDLPDLLYENLDHPRWAEVAERCLSCANCTMVCPTCFCADVQEVSDLTGDNAMRLRVWDSCFNHEFSYIFGGHLRPNIRARYRQWLTHKLAAWVDQFGMSGCVGCGRCITWCPVGIDLTRELDAIRGEAKA
ncbi:MAG: 4Fe-4S dicluster domain-containing protein [Armatimonadota bacterium]|nr:4Fe-4S dicluster domain-containing protein [Armatimonadota bacterium]